MDEFVGSQNRGSQTQQSTALEAKQFVQEYLDLSRRIISDLKDAQKAFREGNKRKGKKRNYKENDNKLQTCNGNSERTCSLAHMIINLEESSDAYNFDFHTCQPFFNSDQDLDCFPIYSNLFYNMPYFTLS